MKFIEVASWGDKAEPFQLVGKNPLVKHTKPNRVFDELWDCAGGQLGFYGFLRVANQFLAARCEGLGVTDMVDWMWQDAYEERQHPCATCMDLLESEGYEFEHDEEDEEIETA